MSTVRAASEKDFKYLFDFKQPSLLLTYQVKASVGDLLDWRDEGSGRWSGCPRHCGDEGSCCCWWRKKG